MEMEKKTALHEPLIGSSPSPSSSPGPSPRNGDNAPAIDLTGYEIRHRTAKHFGLTVKKNFRLKFRKLGGLMCEVLLPPVFMLLLLIGYFAASNTHHDSESYYKHEAVNFTKTIQESVCIYNAPPDVHNPLGWPSCSNSCGGLRRIAEMPWGQVCASDYSRIYEAWRGASGGNGSMDIPHLDAYLTIQLLAYNIAGPLDINTNSPYNSFLHVGSLEFVRTEGVPCEAVKDVIDYFNKSSLLFSYVYQPENVRSSGGCDGVWDSEKAAVDYAKGDGADKTWGVAVVSELDVTQPKIDFTLRFNYTSTPYTFKKQDKFAQGLGKNKPYLQYLTSGYTSVQMVFNQYLLSKKDVAGTPPPYTCPMPTWEYWESEFFERAGNLIPLVMALAFIYPVACLVGGVVEEKEQRLREGMLIMGLSKSAFYTSWFFTYWTLVTVSSILITLLSKGTFLKHTSALLIFLVFELFAMTVISLALLISVFFSKSRIASIVAPLIMFATVVPKFALPADQPRSTQLATSLLSPVAFSYSTELITNYETSGQGSSFSNFWEDDYSYGTSCLMMILDMCIYLFLAWYLDNVLPSEFGVKQHPLFLCMPSYWCRRGHTPKTEDRLPKRRPQYVDTEWDTTTRERMKQRERIRIMGIRKEFNTDDGNVNVAVDNLGCGLPCGSIGNGALTFYEGQIQCVLGHNGAGKTTLINMLTGMLPPTSGDCMIWDHSILDEMDEIRKHIGLCPQHNILWPKLSCIEHLDYYGRIKGVPHDVLHGKNGEEGRIIKMLKLVNLYEKRDAWSSVLSGGQKRKLSVAISLIGGSRLVFLDEPTAGMDVESRRAMWKLLRNPDVLKGRVIVLTTHYMDEADLLGDSIAIMNKGALHSWGSSFFLKSQMGVGYNLSVAMRSGCRPDEVQGVVQKHLPRASIDRISCTGNELRLRLPMDQDPTPEGAKLLDNVITKAHDSSVFSKARRNGSTALREVLSKRALEEEDPKMKEDMEKVLDEVRTQNTFPDVFDELDKRKEELKIEGYGVSITTLEEIFMKIALSDDVEEVDDIPKSESLNVDSKNDGQKATSPNHEERNESTRFDELYSILKHENTDTDQPLLGAALYKNQFKALFIKRFHCARRDRRTLCFQFVLPIFFITLALLLGRLGPPSQPSLELDRGMYGGQTEVEYVPGSGPLFSNCSVGTPETCAFRPYDMVNLNSRPGWGSATTGANLSQFLLDDYNHHKHVTRPFAVASPDTRPDVQEEITTLLHNATYYHSIPASLSAFHLAILRSVVGDSAGLVARNHPLPFSNYEQKLIESFQVIITGIFIMIPFTFIPSNFVSFIVKERECKAKHVQVVSGVFTGSYWLANFVFDLIMYLCTMILAFIVFIGDDRKEFIKGADTVFASILLFLLFGISVIVQSYLVSFLFSSHSKAQRMVMILNFITGFILVIAAQILDFIDSTKDANKVLKYFYRLVPSYCLGEGIINLSMRPIMGVFDAEKSPFEWTCTGVDLFYMGLLTPIFLIGTMLIEVPSVRRIFRCKDSSDVALSADGKLQRDGAEIIKRRGAWLMVRDLSSGNPYYFNEETGASQWNPRDTPFHVDEAVQAHAKEVNESEFGRPGDFVTVQQLSKVWPPAGNMARPKVAVSQVSFGVESGELFAFLGTNGAGKTTTLSVLSGEFPPTSGRAFIGMNPATGHGYDVETEAQMARQSLGFCPQFDALLDLMTPEEHLWLFARLRGIPEHHIKSNIDILLTGLGLTPHKNKVAKSLSGGNKRKLSVAVALMGGPPVIFLDEPSAGMDPVARRSLWGALEKAILQKSLSVVLTTHHLEEIEGLAHLKHRVTIMVDGVLQCLGSLGQLKNQLGDAYELTMKVVSTECEEPVKRFIERTWPSAVLTEENQQRLTYQLAKTETTLSQAFRLIEANREMGISDYSINETSLEQVFIRISKRALREEDAEVYQTTGQTGPRTMVVHVPSPPVTRASMTNGHAAE